MIPSAQLTSGVSQGQAGELVLHLWPRSVGPREFVLKLFFLEPFPDPSSFPDPPEQALDVRVRADVETLPACTMTVQPARSLQLTEASGGGLEGSITFTNTGLTSCLVDDVHLASPLPNFFIVSG